MLNLRLDGEMKMDEPPSESNQDSIKLCLSRKRDLHSVIFGCQPLLAGCNSFRSLVAFGEHRRGGVLETNQKDK